MLGFDCAHCIAGRRRSHSKPAREMNGSRGDRCARRRAQRWARQRARWQTQSRSHLARRLQRRSDAASGCASGYASRDAAPPHWHTLSSGANLKTALRTTNIFERSLDLPSLIARALAVFSNQRVAIPAIFFGVNRGSGLFGALPAQHIDQSLLPPIQTRRWHTKSLGPFPREGTGAEKICPEKIQKPVRSGYATLSANHRN